MYKKFTQWGLEGAGSVLSLGPSRRQPHKQYISLTHAQGLLSVWMHTRELPAHFSRVRMLESLCSSHTSVALMTGRLDPRSC